MNGYFDFNATTPMHPEARAAWLETADRFWHNPSSLYRQAGAARQKLEDCREQVADWLECEAEQIIFLSGATEANNAVVAHAASSGWEKIAIGAGEHPCLQEPAQQAFGERCCVIPLTPDGLTDLHVMEGILKNQRPSMAAVMAANNETGVLQPWRQALELCREHGVLFHCDAAQWIGKKPSAGLGDCDFITGSAHKFGGPKGVGFLKVPASGRPLRWLRGGPQEDRRRAGTENLPGIAAMVAAWSEKESKMLPENEAALLAGRAAFESRIKAVLPDVQIVAEKVPRLWNTVLLTVPPPGNLKWLTRLSNAGFALSTGSACSRGAGASEVLQAMGLPDSQQSQILRISGGWETRTEDWLALADAMAGVAADLHKRPLAPAASAGASG